MKYRKNLSTLKQIIGFILVTSITMMSLKAEISPDEYEKMRDASPEKLTLIKTKVNKGWCLVCTSRDVEVEALVESVEASATGLKPKQTIKIEYTYKQIPIEINGPRGLPMLKENRVYTAFLKKRPNEDIYEPAARGASFEDLL